MTKEEILEPFIEKPFSFSNVKIVSVENAMKAMDKYAKEVANDLTLGWISIQDKTPPDYQDVLFFDSRVKKVSYGYFVWSQSPCNYVSHWRELPLHPDCK